jgi:hypothetical protein
MKAFDDLHVLWQIRQLYLRQFHVHLVVYGLEDSCCFHVVLEVDGDQGSNTGIGGAVGVASVGCELLEESGEY